MAFARRISSHLPALCPAGLAAFSRDEYEPKFMPNILQGDVPTLSSSSLLHMLNDTVRVCVCVLCACVHVCQCVRVYV